MHNLPSQPIEIYQDQISAGTSANQEACWGMAESGRFRGLKAQRSSRASPPPRSAGASRRGEGRLHAARGLLDHEALCMCTAKSLQAFALEVDTGLSLQRRRTHTAQGPKAQGLVGFQRSLTSEAKGIASGSQAAWHRARTGHSHSAEETAVTGLNRAEC